MQQTHTLSVIILSEVTQSQKEKHACFLASVESSSQYYMCICEYMCECTRVLQYNIKEQTIKGKYKGRNNDWKQDLDIHYERGYKAKCFSSFNTIIHFEGVDKGIKYIQS